MTLETLRALQTRIREATGADRELDADIAALFLGGEIEWRQANYTMDLHPVRKYASTMHVAGFGRDPVIYYTASIDACVALMREVLPGWSWQVGAYPQVHAHVAEPVMTKYGPGIGVRAQTSGATVSLAFLDAIMSAVIAEEEQEKVNV